MKQIIFAMSMIAVLLASCASEPANDEAAAPQPAESEAVAASSESKPKEAAAPPARPAEAPKTGERGVYQPPKSGDVLYLSFGNATAKAGEEVCLPLTAKGFTQLLSNQYTIAWDPAVLEFSEIKDFGMPKMSMQNFGTTQTAKGILPFVWIDATLQGVSIPDGQPLYSICFKAVGKSGQSSEVRLAEQPTPFEVVTVKEELQDLSPSAGSVTIQ